MPNIIIILILSITQAVTEFLPISSSAHLLIAPWLLNFTNPGLAFDAALHIGTALALLVFFGKEFFLMIKSKDKLLYYIIVASIPAAVLGFFGDKVIERYLHNSSYAIVIVAVGMIFFSIVLYVIDKNAKLIQNVENITLKQSLIIGFAQALSLVPGTSRSGITITAGLWTGLKRDDAARFSFLLATPISLGAGLYKLIQITQGSNIVFSKIDVFAGIVVTFLVSLVVIKWLLNYLKKHSMLLFVIYRIVLGSSIIVIWFLRR